jgi:regulator of RNase E activity RraA
MQVFRSVRSFVIAMVIVAATFIAARAAQDTTSPGDPLIAGFKSTYAASVSDAVELVTGKNGTMRYDMKLMTGTNLVGRAVTSLARPAPAAQATPALSVRHSVEIIDEAKPGEVGVIVMEGTLDIAAMGNLMATAAVERGMAGMVLDGAIRDLWDVRRMGLTVYARSRSPRTAVGHYATVAKNIPVECAGVTVHSRVQIAAEGDRQVQPDLTPRRSVDKPAAYFNSHGARR